LDPKDKRIVYVTGRIPRELRRLALFLKEKNNADEDFNQFILSSMNEYRSKLNSLTDRLDDLKKQHFLLTLEGLFTLGLFNGRPCEVEGMVYDQGLMYKDRDQKLFIVSELAKRCLFHYYCACMKITSISQTISGSEKGALFERYLLKQEYNIGKHYGQFYVTNGSFPSIRTSLEYEVNTHQSLSLKDMHTLNRNNYPKGTGVLFIPESETFPSFDYAIITYCEPVEILLKQTTVSTVASHYYNKGTSPKTDVDNLLTQQYIVDEKGKAIKSKKTKEVPKKYLFSLLELIINGVIGFDGKAEMVDEDLTLQPRIQDSVFIKEGKLVNYIKYGDVEFTWHYIYESGATTIGQSLKKVSEHGILFRNREEIGECMKVYFE